MQRLGAWLLPPLLALALAACGSNSTPATSSGQPTPAAPSAARTSAKLDACALYTLDDAQKLLAPAAQKGTGAGQVSTSSDANSVSTCSYTIGGASAGDSRSTTILVRRATDKAQGKQDFLAQKNRVAGAQDVAGLGEAAYWDPTLGQLDVWKGNDWIIVTAGAIGNKDENLAKQVAAVVLSRD